MLLEEIRDIVRYAKNLGLIDSSNSGPKRLFLTGSKQEEFIRLLASEEALSEREVILKLYGSLEYRRTYDSLKSTTVTTFFDIFLNSDVKDNINSALTRGIFDTRKYQLLVTLIGRLGGQKQAKLLARKALKLSWKYQLTSVSIDMLEILRHHALLEGNAALFNTYTLRLEEETTVLADEIKIRTLDNQMRLLFSRKAGPGQSLKKLFPQTVSETKRIASSHPNNFIVQTHAGRIYYMIHQWDGNLDQSLVACQKAISFLTTHPLFASNARLGEFVIYELENHLLLRDYERGVLSAAQCEQYAVAGTSMWFQYKEYHFLLAMQTENFSVSKAILSEILRHRRFELQLPHLKERWHIYSLYVEYVQWVEKREQGDTTVLSLLRYKKYRDIAFRFPNYRRDKRGFNIAIILLNILLLIESHKYDSIVEQIESLDSYRIRYLRDSRTNQTAVLFRMLRIMVTQEFDPKAMQRRTKHLLPLLSVIRQSSHEMTEGLQILSPLWIWNRILTVLQQKS